MEHPKSTDNDRQKFNKNTQSVDAGDGGCNCYVDGPGSIICGGTCDISEIDQDLGGIRRHEDP